MVSSDQKNRRNKMKTKGFTLIEVAVALVIFSIMAMAVFPLTITAMRNNKGANSITEATTFATSVLETLRVAPHSMIVDSQEKMVGSTGVEYTATITVEATYPGNPTPRESKYVRVDVTWTDNIPHILTFHYALSDAIKN
jgi:prepilin-type N-terminal cleavage/methylation domain-containing protein